VSAGDVFTALVDDLARPDAAERVGRTPFRLGHELGPPASQNEIGSAWPARQLDPTLTAWWRTCAEADLFVDLDYGQWGLRLLAPANSATRTASARSERPSEFEVGDVVLGEFLGDLDLLVIESDGPVRIALPLDLRADWPRPAADLKAFLRSYVDSGGDKYWEQPPSVR